MARSIVSVPVQSADMSLDSMRQAVQRIKKRISELEEFDPSVLNDENKNEFLGPLKASIDDTLVRSFGNGTVEYKRFLAASRFDWRRNIYEPVSVHENQGLVESSRKQAISLLKQAVLGLEATTFTHLFLARLSRF
jgi:hypothetical protein